MRKFFPFLLFFFFCSEIFAQQFVINADFLPQIYKLSSTDVVFRQFSDIVLYNDKIECSKAEGEINLETEFYVYIPQNGEDIIDVASFSGIPYDTIATLNFIKHKSEKIEGKKLVLPTVKGIFVAENPSSSVEILVSEEYKSFVEKNEKMCYSLNGKNFCFLFGKRFSSAQRAFFIDTNMRLPLKNIQVTSGFGYRESPVYKEWKHHSGIDFAAKEGTEVFACKSGTVVTVLRLSRLFGNCIILLHEDGVSTVYAHLSKVNVKKGDVVFGGEVIGLTGKTGAVTGPHLHFEIRQNGVATDPADWLEIN